MGSRFLYSVVAAVDGVLANDEDGDGQPLTAHLVQEPNRGTLELLSDGAFVYTPEPGFLGSDRVLYRASDGVLESRDTLVQLGVGNEAWDSRFGSPRLKEQWVTALALGPSGELYAGGTFTAGYGSDSFPHGVARWDGNAWSSLGSGPGNGTSGNVDTLLWWRDRLFVGGVIGEAGGRAAPGIAQWDGHGWTAPGGGVLGRVHALAATEAALYVGGDFLAARGVRASRVAHWNGSTWTALGGGVNGVVRALAIGPGGELFAGGTFDQAGDVSVSNLAVWDGAQWAALGSGVNGPVRALLVSEGALYVGGSFTAAGGQAAVNVARWQNNTWSPLGTGVPGDAVIAFAVDNGQVLAAQTAEVTAGYLPVRVSRWNGSTWTPISGQFAGHERNRVSALLSTAHGLVAGGIFRQAGGTAIDALALWDESRWRALDRGLDGGVDALSSVGDVLHVGGEFLTAGGVTVNRIARWDGLDWHPLQVTDKIGVDGRVQALASSPDGDLFVGGHFLNAGNQAANRIARWDGTRWHALGAGSSNGVDGAVRALVFGDAGELYVGGEFANAGGLPSRGVARWADGAWNDVGGGVSSQVYALAWSGGNLYAGGAFTTVGDIPANRIARWDGTRWHALGSGIVSLDNSPFVLALATRGFDVCVAGGFRAGDNRPGDHLTRWDGVT